MTVYRSLLDEIDGENSFTLRLEELDLYGSEQLGTRYIDDLVRAANLPEVSRTRQRVQYFFRNHLSNVLVRVSDRRIAYPFLGNFDHYESEEVSSHDYYPFGTELRRTENIYGFHTDQRFAFNGKEISHKTGGQTNYDYGFRIYNAGLGRFLSVDPLTKSYPELTPYQFASNTPIAAIDLDGLESKLVIFDFSSDKVTKTEINLDNAGPLGNGIAVRSNHGGINRYFYGTQISDKTRDGFIKDFELFRSYRYGDKGGENGNPTVGWGHLIISKEDQAYYAPNVKAVQWDANGCGSQVPKCTYGKEEMQTLYDKDIAANSTAGLKTIIKNNPELIDIP